MNIAQIEENISAFVNSFSKENFIYDLLLAYGLPKSTITRLKQGNLNLSKIDSEISWKKKLFFKIAKDEDLHELIDSLKSDVNAIKHDPRFIIVTDFETLLAIDRKTTDTLDIPILEIVRYFDFFLPWAGMEKAQHKYENPADVKAAERMAKLFDEIKKDNPTHSQQEIHNLNVFLSRLLFCFFAEDTGIFLKNQFTHSIANHTQTDGSDLNSYLDVLFEVLNTEKGRRVSLPAYLDAFPYVNGGLFRNRHHAPYFTFRSRKAIIESGELNWSAINPDIFGSMIQAVIRGAVGDDNTKHYTSVPNIMKVIEPLFLNDLYEDFEASKNEPKRLQRLHERIGKIKIFDPACGSGNFLIIAYKELRILEIKILQQLLSLQKAASGFQPRQLELIPKAQLTFASQFQVELFSRVQLSQFYGIEIDDFAHEIAILSLWLAQHQMNMRFNEAFHTANPTLPLRDGGHIIRENATRINWEVVCPKNEDDEIYILGNPPYLGYNLQSSDQKKDMSIAFVGNKDYKKLDYISCWFILGKTYIQSINAKCAFVSTNSISQGEQVSLFWPLFLNDNIEIDFAYSPFKWSNNAKLNAGVTVVIIGIRNKSNSQKYIYSANKKIRVSNINPYLTEGKDIIIYKRSTPISDFPIMMKGSQPTDGGHLLLSSDEKENLINNYPTCQRLIKKYIGTKEFINNEEKYCLWIQDDDLDFINNIPEIKYRLDCIRKLRSQSSKQATNELSENAHRFGEIRFYNKPAIIVPTISSERRQYFPIGFIDSETVISNTAQSVYYSEPYIFGIVSCKMIVLWVGATGGKFESRYIFSSQLCYNTFPFPPISVYQKKEIERNVYQIIDIREKYSEKVLSQLYDPETMPAELFDAHHQLDIAVERCYRSKPFESDEERLEYLFYLYEQMITLEKEKNGELIFEQLKTKKRKK